MKKIIICAIGLFCLPGFVHAQQTEIDSVKMKIAQTTNDTALMILFGRTAHFYSELNHDSSYHYAQKMQELARKFGLKLDEAMTLNQMSYSLLNKGNYPRSLQLLLTAIEICEDPDSEKKILPARFETSDDFTDRTLSPRMQRLNMLSRVLQNCGIIYLNSGQPVKAKDYCLAAIPLSEQSNNTRLTIITYSTLGRVYLALKQPDSALYYLRLSYDTARLIDYNRFIGSIVLNIGRAYLAKADTITATNYFRTALALSRKHNYHRGVVATNLALADLKKRAGDTDSILYYVEDGLPVAYYLNAPDLLLRSYTALADYYRLRGNNDSIVKYQTMIIKINDSLFNSKKTQEFQNIDFDAIQRQQQIEAAQAAERAKFKTTLLLAGLGIFLLIAILLYRNSLQRKNTNIRLSRQKRELENALRVLKATQNQLIQSEKMASLGEMTAGIAHEIQNPLNFVNNFSEVNAELIEELKEESEKGNKVQVMAIADSIKENQEKINYHGKRADAIVKSMLQHSRSSSGKKELTDINTLADEYLRLAYHGLRAKDKSFNAKFETQLDPSVGKVEVIPQDIGRVILNLINNAFYAVTEKKRQGPENYEPTVIVSTKKIKDRVEIRVMDNGNGVPPKVLEKIFQPFFTTKPTGEGTGLGLSLSYDIITKSHGGDLKVETKEGEGSAFIISIPVNN